MQAGFAFLEAGSVRSKNTTNILIKNALDSCKYNSVLNPPPKKTKQNKTKHQQKKKKKKKKHTKNTSLYQCHLMIARECVQFSFRTFVVGATIFQPDNATKQDD